MLFETYLPSYIINSPLLDAFILIPACLVLLALIYIVRTYQHNSLRKENPFLHVGGFFSPVERTFYGLLCQASSGERNHYRKALVLGKMSLQEVYVLQSKLAQPVAQRQLKKLSAIHFDYVICDRKDLRVIAVVELQNTEKSTSKEIRRSKYIAKMCQKNHLPYHHFSSQKRYSVEALTEQIFSVK